MNNKENAKQALIGFTEFAKGITGNQNLKIPDDIAKRYGIEQESCGMTTKEDDNVRNSYLAIKATQRQSCEEEDMAKAFQLGLALGLEEKHNEEDCISRQAVNNLVDELARAISDERSGISRGRSTAIIMQDILQLPSVIPQIIEADKEYEVEVITRGKCMMCGKELTDGLFFCKECEDKVNNGKWNGKMTLGEVVIGGHCEEKENGAEERETTGSSIISTN